VKIGISVPLSGAVSDAGTAQLGGARAFYSAINAVGGVRMKDGKTRKIDLVWYDDGYEPARSVQNFRKLAQDDKVLAAVGSLGTAQNAAVMPVATARVRTRWHAVVVALIIFGFVVINACGYCITYGRLTFG